MENWQLEALALVLHAGVNANGGANNANRFRAPEDLANVLGKDDPNRMKLTQQEHDWTVAIKAAIKAAPELDQVSDFMCAQLAIVCQNDVEDALRRCLGLQEFKKEYKVLNTFHEGYRCFQQVFGLFPEQNLSFSFSEKDGTYVFLHDSGKFEPTVFTNAEMADNWLKAMYYWHLNFCPDFESIRKGVIILVECEGMTMRRDVLKHYSALFSQLLTYYPINGQVRHYNTSAMMNVLCSILRQILPDHLKDSFEVGLQFEGNMSEAFLVPTVEIANQRMLARMEETLQRRYNNEQSFSLDS